MKYLPLFFCMVFYACDVGTNNEPSDLSSGSTTGFNSSPSVISSSSFESSSSSEQHVPCRIFSLSDDELHFSFGKQGGIDSLITTTNIHGFLEGPGIENCEYFRADHFLMEEEEYVKSDYCKNNYCHDRISAVFNSSAAPIMKKECSWYNVALTSKNSLLISVNKNETGKERSKYISFGWGGCALMEAGFTITQSARK
jgi:hypothetical protein